MTTAQYTLTKTRLHAGIWEGVLIDAGEAPPSLALQHENVAVSDIMLTPGGTAGTWHVQAPVPAQMIADGMQTFTIVDQQTGDILASFAVLAGETLNDDIRADIGLLRAELDMLKRTFRRHFSETPPT